MMSNKNPEEGSMNEKKKDKSFLTEKTEIEMVREIVQDKYDILLI